MNVTAHYYLAGGSHIFIIWLSGARDLMRTLNSRKLQLEMAVVKDSRMKHAQILSRARKHKFVILFFITVAVTGGCADLTSLSRRRFEADQSQTC